MKVIWFAPGLVLVWAKSVSAVMWVNVELPFAESAELLVFPWAGAGSPANLLPSSTQKLE